jgi:hypothetical protein
MPKRSPEFTDQLEAWLKTPEPKTLYNLSNIFGEKSFAVLFVILLAIPALPVPTVGLTHIFEIIAMLLALQVMIGRKTLWLPDKWKRLKLGSIVETKVLPTLIKYIRKIENYSKPRLNGVISNKASFSLFGVLVFVFSLVAFLAPPFSGLDTLPSLAVILLSLGIILEDAIVYLAGIVIGSVGLLLVIVLGEFVLRLITN